VVRAGLTTGRCAPPTLHPPTTSPFARRRADYLLSNNYVNQIICHKFDFSDEEILAYYISFLKTLSLKLNKNTIHFFYNEVLERPRELRAREGGRAAPHFCAFQSAAAPF